MNVYVIQDKGGRILSINRTPDGVFMHLIGRDGVPTVAGVEMTSPDAVSTAMAGASRITVEYGGVTSITVEYHGVFV